MDVKRSSTGVVDAISAEDIGKFPDPNLAESLQRITGVSIDRQRGEGSQVTVRGFGPEYNLVTINGRQMPTHNGINRSFNFADLASEAVAGVQVYKTGQATVPSGGVGSTINISTPRPLSGDPTFSIAGRAVKRPAKEATRPTRAVPGAAAAPRPGLGATRLAPSLRRAARRRARRAARGSRARGSSR